jgi:hypothetical protein
MKNITLLLLLILSVTSCKHKATTTAESSVPQSSSSSSTTQVSNGPVSVTVTVSETSSNSSQSSSSSSASDSVIVQTEVPDIPIPVETDTNVVRLVVSFISKGAGIDYETLKSFEIWLAERPRFIYTKSYWGREGEVNLCFRMSNLSTREQEIFVRDVRTQLTDKDLVIVSEWSVCDKRQ